MKKILLALAVLILSAQVALASGNSNVTFNQSFDCTFIERWDLFAAPAANDPKATDATLVGDIKNQAPLVCGDGATAQVAVVGFGLTRFWLQAVGTDGTRSDFSNFVETVIPLGKPVLISVQF